VLTLAGGPGPGALELPPLAEEGLRLELEGRLSEALDRYRAALAGEETLADDEDLSRPATVFVVSKAAQLAGGLGQAEEAWDLGGRLLSARNPAAVEAGTLVRMRLLRLDGRPDEALALAAAFGRQFPRVSVGPGLQVETARCRQAAGLPASSVPTSGPPAWVRQGPAVLQPDPAEAWGLSVQESVRLQVGAFQDWGHALTLIDMLREKGWVPQTAVKTGAGGEKLHVVYIVSRQPQADRGRLEAQGLPVAP